MKFCSKFAQSPDLQPGRGRDCSLQSIYFLVLANAQFWNGDVMHGQYSRDCMLVNIAYQKLKTAHIHALAWKWRPYRAYHFLQTPKHNDIQGVMLITISSRWMNFNYLEFCRKKFQQKGLKFKIKGTPNRLESYLHWLVMDYICVCIWICTTYLTL